MREQSEGEEEMRCGKEEKMTTTITATGFFEDARNHQRCDRGGQPRQAEERGTNVNPASSLLALHVVRRRMLLHHTVTQR